MAKLFGGQFDQARQEEWERSAFKAAVVRVRYQVKPKNFQVFAMCVLKETPSRKWRNGSE